jgi:LPXTG-motif cell wall-anchored protein
MGYAAAVLLIAPTWLSADELVIEGEPQDPAATAQPAPVPNVQQAAESGKQATEEVAPAPEPAQAEFGEAEAKAEAEEAQAEEPEPAPIAQASADAAVTISDFEFSPASVTVNVGDTVTWTNEGPTLHTATANDGSFDTGNLDAGDSASHTFNEAGSFAYICTPHPFMKGTVVVQAAGSGGGDDDSGSGTGGDDGTTGGGGTDTSGSDTAGTTGDTTSGGSTLAATGSETLMIALLGLLTLGSGLLLRRRGTT